MSSRRFLRKWCTPRVAAAEIRVSFKASVQFEQCDIKIAKRVDI